MEKDKKYLEKLPILDIIQYIRASLFIIIQIKLKEEIEKYNNNKNKTKNIFDDIIAQDYETLLRKEEAEIRQHICSEHQFKLHLEYLEQKIMEIEDENLILEKKIVRNYLFT